MNGYVATKKANEVNVGDRVVEADGAYFEVLSATEVGNEICFRLENVAAYMVAPQEVRVRRTALVRVFADDA